jgi:dephospho-CoA kinase
MYVVALTGGIGSGKSEAARIFAELGVPVTDVDDIAHALTADNAPLNQVIAAEFGAQYITPTGALNRAAMRQLVFTDDSARAKLNAILHPAIFANALAALQANNHAPYQVLAIPLLFESPRYLPHVNRILLIDCDEKLQIERVKNRSKMTVTEIKAVIKTQTPRIERIKQADDIIINDKNIENLRKSIVKTHKKYIKNTLLLA